MAENQNIEWKESWRDEYLKWICGFANAQGGKIYIGTNDDGNVVGVQDGKKLLEDIPNKVRDVLGIIVDVNMLIKDGKEYIEICVNPNSYPVNYKGQYHYRSGSTKQQLKGQALNQFLLQKTGITWDSVPVQGVSVKELRHDSFDIFREQAVLSKRMDKKDIESTNEQLLDSLNLLENGMLKRAAILLFHHNPEKWVPGAYVKIGYFESDSELRYQDEIHGSLISQAGRVVDLIFTKYLKAIISYRGVTRVETFPFPKEAIREAVFNAIAHKFYGALIPIQISVYSDKIYIANDCIFPEDWTIEDLMGKHRSRPYNPLIANTFFRAGFIESWGRGIEKIKDSCKAAGNPMPEYTIKREDIMVLFKSLVSNTNQAADQVTNQAQYSNENSISERILKVIRQEPSLSQKKIANRIGENYSTVKYYMETMKKSGIIKREGTSQKGRWVII
ncbi:MAG: ATP-binding protein [Lachnospiraceae bacterium]